MVTDDCISMIPTLLLESHDRLLEEDRSSLKRSVIE